MSQSVIYLIESGFALDLVKKHVQEVCRVQREAAALAGDLGCTQGALDPFTGVLRGVAFPQKKHPDFTVPNRRSRVSSPKKGTEWAARFAAQKGHAIPEATIQKAFGVPLSIEYTCDGGYGSSAIGDVMNACGFLSLSDDGPFALWIPDVHAEVAAHVSQGHVVDSESKNFTMSLPGCRRIEDEEWDIMVAQHSLAEKKKAREKDLVLA